MSADQHKVPARSGCSATVDHDRNVPDVDLLSPLTIRGVTFRQRTFLYRNG